MPGDVQPSSRKVHAQGNAAGRLDPVHQLGGGNLFGTGRCFGEHHVPRSNPCAQVLFKLAVRVIFRNGQDIGPLFQKDVFKVHSRHKAFSADHLVHHGEAFQKRFFMVVGYGRFSVPAAPEHLFRGKGDNEAIPQSAGFTEKLEMARMNDIIKA